MLFTSFSFAVFVPVCLLVYYLLPQKYRWYALFEANFVFYHGFGRRRLVCLLFSALTVWAAALAVEAVQKAEKKALAAAGALSREEKKKRKARWKARANRILVLCLVLNLGLLLFFKFYGMAAGAVSALPRLNLLAPVGISFYTLQAVSYVIDVSRRAGPAEKNPLKLILFTMYFPQLIEGPISRYNALAPQLYAGRPFDYDCFVHGLQRILWGLLKKLVLADRLYMMVDYVFSNCEDLYGFTLAVGIVGYTIQLYADFSGGIDIALGVSELFHITLAENFHRPFFSKTISEFWRRWHITLGTWLRDYLFYPLTLSKPLARLGKWLSHHVGRWAGKWIPSYIALLVLWVVNGIWHGEGAQYIAFGLYHGILILLGMSFAPLLDGTVKKLRLDTESASWRLFRVLRTFLLVCFGEMIFRSESVELAVITAKNLFSKWNPLIFCDGTLLNIGLDRYGWVIVLAGTAVLFGAELAERRRPLGTWLQSLERPFRWPVYFAGLYVLLMYNAMEPLAKQVPFIYFQF